MGFSKSAKREIHNNTNLPQETRKASNKQPNFTPRRTGKGRMKLLKVSRRKEIIKIRSEIKMKNIAKILLHFHTVHGVLKAKNVEVVCRCHLHWTTY